MNNGYEKLKLFFERITTLTFFQRVFNWKSLKSLSYQAYEEFKLLISSSDSLGNDLKRQKEKNDDDEIKIKSMIASIASKEETIKQNDRKIFEIEKDLSQIKQKIDQITRDNSELTKENNAYKQTENNRRDDYDKKLAVLSSEIVRVRDERAKEQENHQRSKIEKLASMKETWNKHQEKVKEAIKLICQKHTIEYIENVPFKGNPDNTIKICDEFFIFDAKSPSTDDLNNFPTYIKNQTESVKKYVKEENVRKDVFLVIPSNTVDVINQFSYNLADYNVYIVTIDVLEPLILSLKKIEDYEFVNQLSPDERENICRVIGKFAHMTKRRIQIDQFFERQFLDILTKCETDLPNEILEKVVDYEKSEKLNPPQEKRAKLISSRELEVDSNKIRKEVEAKEITSIRIQELPPSENKSIE